MNVCYECMYVHVCVCMHTHTYPCVNVHVHLHVHMMKYFFCFLVPVCIKLGTTCSHGDLGMHHAQHLSICSGKNEATSR